MKHTLLNLLLLIPFLSIAQNIHADWTTYTPQQLIEDILIDSPCIENVVVTNTIGGDFETADLSYGYFDGSGSSFPFQRGIVLSTGKLVNTEGPNDRLSDDDAPGWIGDADLENVLNETNTLNATIMEFEFTSLASQISFRYLFASEEYQENDPNTCVYSDLFGFLIRPVTDTQYTNIALVPGTNTPVKVTTVHPDISGGCAAINEDYFESFNGTASPINFNGQTKVMTATATVNPNETYHVKLVIADHVNYRYDSAVFLEAGSFELTTDLGEDRLIANNTALCQNEILDLDAAQPGNNTYDWFKDAVLVQSGINPTYTVTDAGIYSVEVTLSNSCISYGEIIVEYAPDPIIFDSTLLECDLDQDGLTLYNLFDSEEDITNLDTTLQITDFFLTFAQADFNSSPIPDPLSFSNSSPLQIVFARVVNTNGCPSIAELQLDISNNQLVITPQTECNEDIIPGYADFDLNSITTSFQSQIPATAFVEYFESEADAMNDTNTLASPYKNTIASAQTIFVKVTDASQCFAISPVELIVFDAPQLVEDEEDFYCTDTYPATKRIYAGVTNGPPTNFSYRWYFNSLLTSVDTFYNDINEIGTFLVEVTDSNYCTVFRTITVSPSSSAIIENISIEEGTYKNTVTISVSGDGNYEYALGNSMGPYQLENTFTNVFPGFYNVYVRDINGCAIVSKEVSILGFPKFFTPNNDGKNDTWKVFGVNENFNQDINILIFDRFGKVLANLNYLSDGWDGIYNGHALPSSDYWYKVLLDDGRTYRGHFTLLKR